MCVCLIVCSQLILIPYRLLILIDMFCALPHFSISSTDKLSEEFGPPDSDEEEEKEDDEDEDDDEDNGDGKKRKRRKSKHRKPPEHPDDWNALFKGNNVDDDFKIGQRNVISS